MLTKILKPYKNLSKEIWIITFMTLINRAGAMVIPFLTLYLTKSLHFTLDNVTWIMVCFGFGSLAGTWSGGKLTDKIGYYKVMYLSLFLTGWLFFALSYFETIWGFAIGIFVVTFVSDTFRPAIWVAISAYSKEENRTRSVTLVRLAINLGYAVGPALAGFIIANLTYKWLFLIDGFTAIIASVIIYFALSQKNISTKKADKKTSKNIQKPYKDKEFILFWFAIFLCGFAFVQFIELWPLYYKDIIKINEQEIGFLMALNGIIIFLFEMPIVDYLDKKVNHINLMIFGMLLFVLSFFVLTLANSIFIIVLSMVLISFGEVFSFPFSNTFALKQAEKGNQGEYMAFYTMTFSAAFIVGPLGIYLVNLFGYNLLWYLLTAVLFIAVGLLYLLKK